MLKEECELYFIKDGFQYDKMGRYWIVIYLWVKDLKFFFNNLSVVVC